MPDLARLTDEQLAERGICAVWHGQRACPCLPETCVAHERYSTFARAAVEALRARGRIAGAPETRGTRDVMRRTVEAAEAAR